MTYKAAIHVASNLLPADFKEVTEGHGHDPMVAIPLASANIESKYIELYGEIAAVAGIYPTGQIWMLCTDVIYKYPLTFSRGLKRYLNTRKEKKLWNIADKRNAVHLKLLRFLDFQFLGERSHGPNNLPFIEFCRVQSNSSRSRDIRSRSNRSIRSIESS
mgnify:CR=1 FL=1